MSWCFVRVTESGHDVGRVGASCAIERLGVTSLTDLERCGEIDLGKGHAEFNVTLTHRGSRDRSWGDERDHDDETLSRQNEGHFAGSTDVFVPIVRAESQVAAEAGTEVVAVDRRHGDVALLQVSYERVGGRRLPRTGETREPYGSAGVLHALTLLTSKAHDVERTKVDCVITRDVFKAYDIRGTYPDQIDASLFRAIGSAFATFTKAPRIVIGRDMRPSGVELARAFAEGARACGAEVVDIGLASTDFLYFASGHLDIPGAMFTASHNPAQYNGIKLCLDGAKPIGAETGLFEIEDLTNEFLSIPASGVLAATSSIDLMAAWVTHVRSFVDVASLRPLRVIADTANGMGGFVAPKVFDGLPFDVEILYPELDGTFPNHPADPIQPENVRDLQARVLATGADVGLAFDGDADRVFLIDDKAQPVSGSVTTAIVADAMLRRYPGSTILHNLICSKAVDEVIREGGGTPRRTRVGHSFIKQVMAETGAVFGGEHSGHYYYRDNFRADSGIITAMIVLQLLSEAKQPLSEFVQPYDRYAASGEINTVVRDPASTVRALAAHLDEIGTAYDELDGLTVDHGSWWYNVRPSNTEPLLRLNLEAPSASECAERVRDVLALIDQLKEA